VAFQGKKLDGVDYNGYYFLLCALCVLCGKIFFNFKKDSSQRTRRAQSKDTHHQGTKTPIKPISVFRNFVSLCLGGKNLVLPLCHEWLSKGKLDGGDYNRDYKFSSRF
jgi:hypothetical protein